MNYLVGYSADRGGREALALGRVLTRTSDVALTVCTVVPERWGYPSPARVDAEYAAFLGQHAQRTLRQARAALAGEVHAQFVARSAPSAADGLITSAEESGAAMIILGSARHGPIGRLILGSVGVEVLHASPVAVALAPKGYRPPAEVRLRRVTCAYAGAPESRTALDTAVELCRRHHVPLRLTTFVVRDKQMYPSGVGYDAEHMVANQWRAQALEAQQGVLAGLPREVRAETSIGDGPDWKRALASLPWESSEVLVTGSSARSTVLSTLLGGSSTRIVRSSPVPVIVIPQGAALESTRPERPVAGGAELSPEQV
jgi:nucleotide-binding universal stress UspA family protein